MEEMGVDKGEAEGGDIFLEEVPADKPGWDVVFHSGNVVGCLWPSQPS